MQDTIPKGYVYVITDSNPTRVKIGYSVKPVVRAKELSTGNADDLVVRKAWPATFKDEKNVQRIFRHRRIRREWYAVEYGLAVEHINLYFGIPARQDHVYIISNLHTGLVRIGHAYNPEDRLVTLRETYGAQLTIVGYWPDDGFKVESLLYACLKPYRENGDWFNLPDGLLQEIISSMGRKKLRDI